MIAMIDDLNYKSKKLIHLKLEYLVDYFIDMAQEDKEYYYSLIFPKSVYVENPKKCEKVLQKLEMYIKDDYIHELSPIYEYALHGILEFSEDLQSDGLLDPSESSKDEFVLDNGKKLKKYNDVFCLITTFFYDMDFYMIPRFFESYKKEIENKEVNKFIEFDKYLGLMTSDVKEEWREMKKVLNDIFPKKNIFEGNQVEEINDSQSLINFVQSYISKFRDIVKNKKGYKLMWNDNNSPRNEELIQILFDNLIKEDCKKNNIDISREVETGRGLVDFKFSKGYNHRILLEIKKASTSKLYSGLEKQVIKYMKSEKIYNLIYMIVVFNKSEYKRVKKVKSLAQEINKGKYNIIVEVIDAINDKKSASNL